MSENNNKEENITLSLTEIKKLLDKSNDDL
jgi:hypothetical protein